MVFSNLSYTWVWEEFGEAMENSFWQVSKKFPLGLARETASSEGVKVSWDVIHEWWEGLSMWLWCFLGTSLWRFSRHTQLERDPETDTQPTGEIACHLAWNASGFPKKNQKVRLESWIAGIVSLACCHCNLTLIKWRIINRAFKRGRTKYENSKNILYIKDQRFYFHSLHALIGAHTGQVKKERAICVKWPV